jgi:hypothetical protein
MGFGMELAPAVTRKVVDGDFVPTVVLSLLGSPARRTIDHAEPIEQRWRVLHVFSSPLNVVLHDRYLLEIR